MVNEMYPLFSTCYVYDTRYTKRNQLHNWILHMFICFCKCQLPFHYAFLSLIIHERFFSSPWENEAYVVNELCLNVLTFNRLSISILLSHIPGRIPRSFGRWPDINTLNCWCRANFRLGRNGTQLANPGVHAATMNWHPEPFFSHDFDGLVRKTAVNYHHPLAARCAINA